MVGWIKLHRKILGNPIFLKPDLYQLFSYCLLRANHSETKIIWNGEEETMEKGCFITGRKAIAIDTGQNESAVYRRLKVLEKLNMISVKSNNKYSIIKVLNYCIYQGSEFESEQPANNQRTTTEQPANTDKNVNNGKNEKKDIVGFFESLWKLYPKKEGKGQVSKTQKQKLLSIGTGEMTRAISRYIKAKEGKDKQYLQNGSTFFNSGYVDYLDKNYQPKEQVYGDRLGIIEGTSRDSLGVRRDDM